MSYELHDSDTANMIAAADTEDETLATVAAYVAAHGRAAVETWVMLRASADGAHKEAVAAGTALAERAACPGTRGRLTAASHPAARPSHSPCPASPRTPVGPRTAGSPHPR